MNLGLGVMLSQLGGNKKTVEAYHASIGQTINKIEISDSQLDITFTSGDKLSIYDDGQSCCEHRYMRTDDDLNYFAGHALTSLELRDAPDESDGYDTHEVQFLIITTNQGSFTIANHNEHNGYYGGFAIVLRFFKADKEC
jgi:hypothetical protein